MTEDNEAFLERWSRRKLEQAEEQPAPPPPSPSLDRAQEHEPAVALPPIEELTPDSDFVPFMNPKVDGETRRAALKKLFTDAHYNIPDPFEAYSEDWTVGEPIPMEMLKTLNHAKQLLFDEPPQAAQAAQEAQPSSPETPQAEVPPLDAKNVPGKQDA